MSMIDAYLPVVILFSVGLTRVHQTLHDARRLAVAGFTRDEILKGMRGVVDERESLREALRGDAETRTRRRRTLVIAVLQLVGAAALIWFAIRLRVQVAPQQFRAPIGAVVMVVSAMCMIGISGVLIARSPIRMPVGERAFRRVWLGPVGRVFLAAGARGVRRDPGGAVPAMSMFVRSTPTSRGAGEGAASRSAAVTSAAVTLAAPSGMNGVAGNGVGSGGDAVARLERRIEALEAWRREGEGEGGKV